MFSVTPRFIKNIFDNSDVSKFSRAYFFVHRSRSSQFKRTCKSLILRNALIIMPVGNLRTAANNDQDDDPRALRPIPIATKDMVSFVEKNNTAAGQNAEVVRFMFFNGFPQRLDLIVSNDEKSALLLVLLFPSSFRE